MRSLFRRLTALDHQHQANGSAVAIALGAILFLQLESPPRPAGADTTGADFVATNLVVSAPAGRGGLSSCRNRIAPMAIATAELLA